MRRDLRAGGRKGARGIVSAPGCQDVTGRAPGGTPGVSESAGLIGRFLRARHGRRIGLARVRIEDRIDGAPADWSWPAGDAQR